MDQATLDTAAGALVAAASALGNGVVLQVATIIADLIQALPAIQKGLASEKPFFALVEKIITEGAVTPDDFAAMRAGLVAQLQTMQAEEDADNAA